jgi:hypothetical protein
MTRPRSAVAHGSVLPGFSARERCHAGVPERVRHQLMSRRRRLPSPAMCVALFAVVLASAGTSYGKNAVSSAVELVTSKQISNNTITSADVKNGTLQAQDFRAGQLPAGAIGPAGPQGPAGKDAATATPGPWHRVGDPGQPRFVRPWTNFNLPIWNQTAFRKTPDNYLELRGVLRSPTNTTSPTTIFFLPAGYRPAREIKVGVTSSDRAFHETFGSIQIFPTGEVLCLDVTDERMVSLDGIRIPLS